MTRIPPREAIAEFVAGCVAAHTAWDSMHEFVTLHWDGETVTPGTVVAIDPGIHPAAYPPLMFRHVCEAITEELGKAIAGQLGDGDGPTLYAYLLTFEGYGAAAPGPGASAQERLAFEAAQAGRSLHTLPDAVEVLSVYCVDIHGRMWAAVKRRTNPEEVRHHFYATPDGAPGGRFVRALRTVAEATGIALHGQPGGGQP